MGKARDRGAPEKRSGRSLVAASAESKRPVHSQRPATDDRKWSTVPLHHPLTYRAMQRAVFARSPPGLSLHANAGTSHTDRWTAVLRVPAGVSGAQRCHAMLVGQLSRFAVARHQPLSNHQNADQFLEPAAQADAQEVLCAPRIAALPSLLPRADTTPTPISRHRLPRLWNFRQPPRKGLQLQRSMPLRERPKRRRA